MQNLPPTDFFNKFSLHILTGMGFNLAITVTVGISTKLGQSASFTALFIVQGNAHLSMLIWTIFSSPIYESEPREGLKIWVGGILTRSFDGLCFTSNSAKIWGGAQCVELNLSWWFYVH